MSYPFFTPFKALILGCLLSAITILGYRALIDNSPTNDAFTAAFLMLCVLYCSFALIAHEAFCEDSKVLTVDFWRKVHSECTSNNNFVFFCLYSTTFANIWDNGSKINLERQRIKKLAKLFLKDNDYNLHKFWYIKNNSFALFSPKTCETTDDECTYSDHAVRKLFADWCINYFTYHKYNP